MFASTQLLLLAGNVAAYLAARQHGLYDSTDLETRRLVQQLAVAQYASAALFGLSWSLGAFHARLYFVPTETSPPQVNEKPLLSRTAPVRLAPSLGLSWHY